MGNYCQRDSRKNNANTGRSTQWGASVRLCISNYIKTYRCCFGATEGIVALALTSHPDFDDTPLWDENSDKNYANDGKIWHPHWVVLTEDKRVEGGLAVKQFDPKDNTVILPPTNPGMPMYMDSPGFQVITAGNKIRVVVPDYRMNNKTDFSYDGVAAYMQVNTGGDGGHGGGEKPMLGVYKVYSVASGNLSLPYKVN